jgi:1-acyl-sn-glycerol-3-phosphate acyltransferase
MNELLRRAFFFLVVRPVLMVILGAQVRHRERLPKTGPAILVANHNSHLDTLTIMAMYRLRHLKHLRPVAAMDYFMRVKALGWFVTHVLGVIAVHRGGMNRDLLARCGAALDSGDIVIVFPEGSRGEPEKLSLFQKGVGHLARTRPEVPVVPLFMHGLGKALPKDSWILVPFNTDVVVGEAFFWGGSMDDFMASLQARMSALAGEVHVNPWD